MPRQTFLHRVLSEAESPAVWKALQRPESWQRIGGVRRVEQPTFDAEGGITGYRFTVDLAGKSHVGTARRSVMVPGRRVTMTIDTDQLGGDIDVELEPSGARSAVTVTMTVQTRGFMANMLFPVLTGAIASRFNDEVERFVAGLTGNGRVPDDQPDPTGESGR
jgi:carbon monoxide dehydrogenase subunit G